MTKFDEIELNKLTIKGLREKCIEQGLDPTGRKKDLIARLLDLEALKAGEEMDEKETPFFQETNDNEEEHHIPQPVNWNMSPQNDFGHEDPVYGSLGEQADENWNAHEEKEQEDLNENFVKQDEADISHEESRTLKSVEVEDYSYVHLDKYHSDLHVTFSDDFLNAKNILKSDLSFFWASTKANYGCGSGQKVFFECKYLKDQEVTSKNHHGDTFGLRIGFSDKPTDHLGDSLFSCGLQSNGMLFFGGKPKKDDSKNLSENKISGCFFPEDVIGVYLDTKSNPAVVCFTVNGKVVQFKQEIKMEPETILYPHVFLKNVEIILNFSEISISPNESELNLSNEFDSMSVLLERQSLSPINPNMKVKREGKMFMLTGLRGSGKTTWAKNYIKEHSNDHIFLLSPHFFYERWKILGKNDSDIFQGKIAIFPTKKLYSLCEGIKGTFIVDKNNLTESDRKVYLDYFKHCEIKNSVIVFPFISQFQQNLKIKKTNTEVFNRGIINSFDKFVVPTLQEGFTEVIYVHHNNEITFNHVIEDYRCLFLLTDKIESMRNERRRLIEKIDHMSKRRRSDSVENVDRKNRKRPMSPVRHDRGNLTNSLRNTGYYDPGRNNSNYSSQQAGHIPSVNSNYRDQLSFNSRAGLLSTNNYNRNPPDSQLFSSRSQPSDRYAVDIDRRGQVYRNRGGFSPNSYSVKSYPRRDDPKPPVREVNFKKDYNSAPYKNNSSNNNSGYVSQVHTDGNSFSRNVENSGNRSHRKSLNYGEKPQDHQDYYYSNVKRASGSSYPFGNRNDNFNYKKR